jgi:hypothetical protein
VASLRTCGVSTHLRQRSRQQVKRTEGPFWRSGRGIQAARIALLEQAEPELGQDKVPELAALESDGGANSTVVDNRRRLKRRRRCRTRAGVAINGRGLEAVAACLTVARPAETESAPSWLVMRRPSQESGPAPGTV